jgi:DeoR/GlpR family transcriptional regulator of sugar metabolism
MPYLSRKIKIEKTEFDRRIKLTPDDKELIKWLREDEQISYQKLADRFGVSKRTIIFIIKPETLEACKKKRAERGGWKQYYDKEANTEVQREHRQYKQKLYVEQKIKLNEKTNNL